MKRAISLVCPSFAAAALLLAAALPAFAAPEPTGPGGVSDSALITVIAGVGDDVFSTTDLSTLLDTTFATSQHYGPYTSTSTDSGTCGNDWATDTFDRHFTIHNNPDGSITVIEQFKDGSFVTPAPDSPHPNPSPGACEGTPPTPPQGFVNDGITGDLHGYFVIPMPPNSQLSDSPYCDAAAMTNANCDTATFINTHFAPCYPSPVPPCAVTTFFFHYSAGDQSLIDHEWKNASPDRGGNSGDIRSVNA